MNTTTELLQQLNTMQTEHIKILEERIQILKHTIKTQERTIKTQEDILEIHTQNHNKRIKLYADNLNNKSNV